MAKELPIKSVQSNRCWFFTTGSILAAKRVIVIYKDFFYKKKKCKQKHHKLKHIVHINRVLKKGEK